LIEPDLRRSQIKVPPNYLPCFTRSACGSAPSDLEAVLLARSARLGKKTPLTLSHFGFAPDGSVLADTALPVALIADWQADDARADQPFPSYARQLAQRGSPEAESRWSWTVDFAARRTKAREEMQPSVDGAAKHKAEVVDLKEKLKRLKREKAADKALEALDAQIREKDKAARDLEAQAAAIDAAVFDLKAVNPNAVNTVDKRTPAEIIASIQAQGDAVAKALSRLNALLKAEVREVAKVVTAIRN
jgi:type I restriction enzyme M protein